MDTESQPYCKVHFISQVSKLILTILLQIINKMFNYRQLNNNMQPKHLIYSKMHL